jgi:hypothetical protein
MIQIKAIADAVKSLNIGKIVPSFMKDHDKKLSSKRIFKLGGGGALIYTGIDFLTKAVEHEGPDNEALIAGAICIAVGTFLAIGLSEKIKNLTVEKPKEEN